MLSAVDMASIIIECELVLGGLVYKNNCKKEFCNDLLCVLFKEKNNIKSCLY